MAMRGQTWHEKAKNITIYRLELKENFLEIFGFNWCLAIFYPFARSQLPSDGTHFKKSNSNQEGMYNPYCNLDVNNQDILHENQILRRKF